MSRSIKGGMEEDREAKRASSERTSLNPTRRQLLGTGGAGLLTALAGCSGDGGGDATATGTATETETETEGDGGADEATETATATEGGEPMEAAFDRSTVHLPSESVWQPFHAKWPGATVAWYLHQDVYVFVDGSTEKMMVDDWSYVPEESMKEVTIRDDMVWHNGQDVLATDEWRRLEIERLFDPENSLVKEHELVDDYTIRFNWKADSPMVARSLAKLNIGGAPATRRDVLKPWHEKLQDAANQGERDSISEQMSGEWTISTQEWMDRGLGYGPWKMTGFRADEIRAEQWEEHPLVKSGEINIQEFVQRPAKNQAKRQLLIKNDEIDGREDEIFPKQLRSASPDHLQTLAEFPFVWIPKLSMNWTGPASPFLQHRGSRRAIACIIDVNNIITNNNGRGVPITSQSGMDEAFSKKWLGQDFLDKLIKYPVGQDLDQAEQYLAQTPFTRKNGRVVDEDGEQVELTAVTQNSGWRLFAQETMAQQLSDYGFKINFNAMTWTKMESITLGPKATMDYDLHVNSHYAGINFHPIDYYWPTSIFGHRLASDMKTLERWYEEGKGVSPKNGKPLTPTVPKEVGAKEVTGSGVDIPWAPLWKELKFEADQERAEEIVKKFAQYWNYDVPDYDPFQREIGAWGDVKNWQWPEPWGPDEMADVYKKKNNVRYLLRTGRIKSKLQ